MNEEVAIRPLPAAEAEARLGELSALLVDAVEHGASVNFLAGLTPEEAGGFWRRIVPGIGEGSLLLFVAEARGRIVGTVILFLAGQPNGQHRAEIGKMLVHSAERRRGIGGRLLAAAEGEARRLGRTLLVLDTERGSEGERLYRRRGWRPVGTIAGFALNPAGVPSPATIFMKDLSVLVRAATPAELPGITAIYAHAVETGTASFELAPPDEAEMGRRLAALVEGGFPYLVAEADGAILGYAYAGPYRARPAYRFAVENSVYVAPEAKGRGVGRALLERLLAEAEAAGFRQMIAVIGDSANAASIALHRACGFAPAGTLRSVGWKHGVWLDSVFMQRGLGASDGAAPPAGR